MIWTDRLELVKNELRAVPRGYVVTATIVACVLTARRLHRVATEVAAFVPAFGV